MLHNENGLIYACSNIIDYKMKEAEFTINNYNVLHTMVHTLYILQPKLMLPKNLYFDQTMSRNGYIFTGWKRNIYKTRLT